MTSKHPEGMTEISRWLSEATPPVVGPQSVLASRRDARCHASWPSWCMTFIAPVTGSRVAPLRSLRDRPIARPIAGGVAGAQPLANLYDPSGVDVVIHCWPSQSPSRKSTHSEFKEWNSDSCLLLPSPFLPPCLRGESLLSRTTRTSARRAGLSGGCVWCFWRCLRWLWPCVPPGLRNRGHGLRGR